MHLFSLYSPNRRSMVLGLTLLGVWFAGLALGLLAACFYGVSFGALALSAGSASLSFWAACLVAVLPLLFSAFAVFFFHRFGAYLGCAVRGLTIGFLMGVLTAAGGLWLSALLLFTALGSCPVLLWFLWRRLELGLPGAGPDGLRCLAWCCLLAAVDSWAVAPFLAAALSF